MAMITGSTAIDWSTISVDPTRLEDDILLFANRLNQVFDEIDTGRFFVNPSPPPSPTFLSLTLTGPGFAGATVTLSGSGFDASPVINVINYNNGATGESLRFTGTIDEFGTFDVLTSARITVPGFETTINGNILINSFTDAFSGTATSAAVKFGTTTVTVKGSFSVAGDLTSFDLSGNVSEVRVVSGPNTIVMTGLSFPITALDTVDSVDDILALVGPNTPGNDVINYTNNGPVGMTFHGGDGNDTIIVNGPNGDTLFGDAGNDVLRGGFGPDTLDGGADQDTATYAASTSGVTANLQTGTGAGGEAQSDTLAGIENLIGSAFGDTLTGDAGPNVLTGNAGNDTLNGGAGADNMNGGAGNDTYGVDSAGDAVTEAAGGGTDTIQSSITFSLGALANVENVTLIGGASINATGNGVANQLTGNSGVNTLDGGAGNDTLLGGDGNDTLIGGPGADTLNGQGGDDTLNGGADNDLYIVASDTIVEALNQGIDTVQSSAANFALPANVENLILTGATGLENLNGAGNPLNNVITGNAGNNVLTGDAGNDTLIGGLGDDHLDGGLGNDTLNGGSGNDTLVVGQGTDTVVEAAGGGIDTIQSPITFSLAALPNVENLMLIGAASINATGNAGANVLTGNDGNNVLRGGLGADALNGGNGNDTASYAGSAAGVTIGLDGTPGVGGEAAGDTLANIENLIGSTFKDTLSGDNGLNVLNGGAGADTLIGGAGNDTYVVDNVGDQITEEVGSGVDTVQASISYSLEGKELEHLTLVGAGTINATGNDKVNSLTGNNAANRLDGKGGGDLLLGGGGNDVYVVDNAVDIVQESTAGAAGGIDRVESSVDFTLGANVEHLTLTGVGNSNGTGNELANTLIGNSGNNVLMGLGANDLLVGNAGDDTLIGGAGNDSMNGGAGNDTYEVDAPLDVVTEALAGVPGGTDTVFALVNYLLGANVENLVLLGGGDLNGTGNGLANQITGNGGANLLRGGLGADVLNGAGGTDTASYVSSAAGVTVDLLTGAGVGGEAAGDTLAAIENLLGSAFNDTLRGDAGANVLNGGAGADSLIGRGGNDTYVVNSAGDLITELAGEGTDTVQSSIAYSLEGKELENLTLTGALAINATGNGGANLLTGNNAANRLDGKGGADNLIGAGGNDTYVVDDADDVVTEAAGAAGGIDRVESSVDFDLSGTNVEHLTLLGVGDIDGTGNASANTLIGNAGSNTLLGDPGNDVLIGNAGNDTLGGGTGNDSMNGGAGNDIYEVDAPGDVVTEGLAGAAGGTDLVRAFISHALGANVENLVLMVGDLNGTGNALANEITGNPTANRIAGGLGNDTLAGGADADQFVFNTAPHAVTNLDHITDFTGSTGDGDRILLENAVFVALGLAGPLNPAMFGLAGAQDANDRIVYNSTTGELYYDANGLAPGATLFAMLDGAPALAAGDFNVI